MSEHLDDKRVRLAAFKWLEQQVDLHGDVLPRGLLSDGFVLEGRRVPLVSRQGIFKPAVLAEIPLSISTTPKGPYDDRLSEDGLMLYSYRGTDPEHRDNVGLRKAMTSRTPLIYLHGILPGRYMAVWPVFVVGDSPGELMFKVAVDSHNYLREYAKSGEAGIMGREERDLGRRQYTTQVVRQRLHQRGFRERVLNAYKQQCALCRLRHAELLDAAHIIPDGEPGGEPVVNNGLALCKLHHAAFDEYFLGISPDYVITIRKEILEEEDGPMLTHGLQGLNGSRVLLPRSRRLYPSRDRLEVRWDRFVRARATGR
jgi:putative restriction endonuclease